MGINKIFVAGAGLMGGGISQVSAQAGYQVVMQDLSDEILNKSLKAIRWSVGKLMDKGRVKGTVEEIMGRIEPTTHRFREQNVRRTPYNRKRIDLKVHRPKGSGAR